MTSMDTTTQKQQARARALAQRDAISPSCKDAKSASICNDLSVLLDDALSDGVLIGGKQDASKPFTVAVYAAFQNEVRLDAFIRHAYARGCHVAFPCMNRQPIDGLPMVMRAVDATSYETCAVPFVSSPIEAFEPDEECVCDFPIVDPKEIDMLVVPMVAFDSEGMRLAVPFVSSPIEAFEPDEECVCDFPIVDPKEIDMLVVPMVAFDSEGMRLGYGGGNYDTFMPRLSHRTRIAGVAFAEQQLDAVPFDFHDRKIDRIITA